MPALLRCRLRRGCRTSRRLRCRRWRPWMTSSTLRNRLKKWIPVSRSVSRLERVPDRQAARVPALPPSAARWCRCRYTRSTSPWRSTADRTCVLPGRARVWPAQETNARIRDDGRLWTRDDTRQQGGNRRPQRPDMPKVFTYRSGKKTLSRSAFRVPGQKAAPKACQSGRQTTKMAR